MQYLHDYPSNPSKIWYTYSPRQGLPNKSRIARIQSLEAEILFSKVRVKNKLSNQFRPIRSSNFTAPHYCAQASVSGFSFLRMITIKINIIWMRLSLALDYPYLYDKY